MSKILFLCPPTQHFSCHWSTRFHKMAKLCNKFFVSQAIDTSKLNMLGKIPRHWGQLAQIKPLLIKSPTCQNRVGACECPFGSHHWKALARSFGLELFGRVQIGLGQKHSLDYFNNTQDHILLPGNRIIN